MESKEMKILIFSLNNESYGTDISDVERILGFTETTGMPEAPDFVEGVINYENRILPIINLRKKFNFISSGDNENAKIIVIKRKEKKFGVIVDNVYEVTDVSNDLFEEAPAITATVSSKYIKGLVKLKDRIVILLNIGNILSEDEEELIF